MPMLTTFAIVLPVWPVHSPERTRSANAAIRSSTSCTSATTSCPSTTSDRVARQAQRDVQHGAVLGDVDVLAANIASRRSRDAGLVGEPHQQARASRP